MSIQVLEAQTEDMDRIFEIASLAFDRNEPMWDVMWPLHWTPSGRTAGGARMLQTRSTDKTTTYLKAVDPSTNQIMGMAKWNVFTSMPDLGEVKTMGPHWETEEDERYATAMVNLFLKERNEAIRENGGKVVSLDILTIDPKFQRRGVGGALVSWGTRKADEMGVEAVVESSIFGRGLYEKNGFVFVKDVKLQSPKPFEARGEVGGFAWLRRPARNVDV